MLPRFGFQQVVRRSRNTASKLRGTLEIMSVRRTEGTWKHRDSSSEPSVLISIIFWLKMKFRTAAIIPLLTDHIQELIDNNSQTRQVQARFLF